MLLIFAYVWLLATVSAIRSQDALLYSNSFGVLGKNASYDYVVVGGGTAGLAIAARLAEHFSVAVIEAGSFYEQDNGNGSVIPGLATAQYTGGAPNVTQPLIDWDFVTVPQAGAAHRRIHYARGKTLGGSSARNYMSYHRGSNGSYQRWADEVGDRSYTFDNLLHYFQKSVHLTAPDYSKRQMNGTAPYDPAAFNNTIGGPLQVAWSNYAFPLGTWTKKGLTAVGVLPSRSNLNSGNLMGSAWPPITIEPVHQHRSSSETSFLTQAIQTTDIKVYTRTMAERVVFGVNNSATGVMVQTSGMKYLLAANKEVIVSAGAFQSPQILMVSGIGPRKTLEMFNITVLKDLPGVGQNLWDQPLFGVSYRVNVPTSSKRLNDPLYAAQAAQEYLYNQSGPLTGGPAYLAFENLPPASRKNLTTATLAALDEFPADWPEIEYLTENGFSAYNEDYSKADPLDGYNYGTISAALMAPTSRGNVTIASSSMSDPPVINPNWLTTAADTEVAVAAFKRVRQIWSHVPGVTIGPEYFPGAEVATDGQILENIRRQTIQLWHAAATCKMGKATDPLAVVDSKARVFGTQKLRVVDASSFPFLTPGHPQSGVYMLAEKIADDIITGV